MVHFLLILFALGVLYHFIAFVALVRLFRREDRPLPPLSEGPGITVFKPVKGLTPETRECLASFLAQDYRPYQVLFGAAAADDPVIPLLWELKSQTPPGKVEIVICPEKQGHNPKVSTLRQLESRAAFGLLLVADQDIKVPNDLLGRVARALQEPGAGLVSCPYRAGKSLGLGAMLEALTISGDFIPGVAVARLLQGVTFALGGAMAFPRAALQKIGGFAPLADYLADDYQLGQRIWKAGYKVDLLPVVVETVNSRMSFREFLSHQGRWSRTYRVCRPWGYLGFGLGHLWVWGLALVWLGQGAPWTLGLLAGALVLRLGLTWFAEKICLKGHLHPFALLLVPLKDLISFCLWASSFFIHQVTWQGRRYRLSREGLMTPLK